MRRWHDILVLGSILAMVAVLITVATLLQSAARPSQNEDLFIAIGHDPETYLRTARSYGGWSVTPQTARYGVLVTGPPGMAQALRQTGAWFVIPANGLSFLCAAAPDVESFT